MHSDMYRLAFEHATASLWLEDIGAIRSELSSMKRGVAPDLVAYLDSHPEFLDHVASTINVIDVNLATVRIYGAGAKEDLLGPLSKTLDLSDPNTRESIRRETLAIAAGETVLSRESLAIAPSGKRLNISVTTHLFPETENESQMLVSIEDITAQRNAERALVAAESRYRQLFDSVLDAFVMVGMDGRIVECNQAFTSLLGYDDGELPSKVYAELIPDRWRIINDRVIREQVIPQGYSEVFEKEYRRKDGSIFPAETKISLLLGEEAQPRGMWVAVRDITERREAEEKLRAFIEQSTEAIWIIDRDGAIIEFNPGAERLTGISRENAIATPAIELLSRVFEQDIESADSGSGAYDLIRRIFAVGDDADSHKPMFFTLKRPDGTLRHFEHFYFAIHTRGGRQVGAIAHDITDIHNARETLRRVESQLHQAQKMEAVGQLAGGVAHDFNNILTSIMGYCSLLRMQMGEQASGQSVISDIVKAARRAAHVTEGLLFFSRKSQLALQPVDLNEVIQQNLSLLRRMIGEDLELEFTQSSQIVQVRADSTGIEQVLMNLATNARDAMPHGGRIRVQLTRENIDVNSQNAIVKAGWYAHIAFSDFGIGMEAGIRDKVFEPFFTTKAVGKGSGLGLSVVWGIVEQHGGQISVESAPGHGTTFHIYLPLSSEQPEEPEHVEEVPQLRGSETILVAEDEEMLRGLIKTILDAIAQFTAHHEDIDLALLDVVMPKLDGRLALERILQIAPALKAIFMSGYTPDLIESRGILSSDIDLIRKPFTPSELAERVRTALDS